MTIPNTPHGKTDLRALMRRTLRGHPPGPSTSGDTLDLRVRRLEPGRTIATYAAIPGEIDLADLARRHSGHIWVYPRVDGDKLHFHVIREPSTELQTGCHGIAEPVATTPKVAITAIDVFLCPGLAFDRKGGRLGRGGGYYDRVLAGARHDALRIGVCSSTQIVDDTFAEAHDIRMHEVISIG